ncbi:MAG TPA: helix-turn-helix domain-containing protein, partial [Pyrinomonadaceae bacterium]
REQLRHVFSQFLLLISRQGADASELKALLRILQAVVKNGQEGAALLARIKGLCGDVVPEQLTLAEAARLYSVKADTLRRACWAGILPGRKRGKTWFVKVSDLENYIPNHIE